MSDDFTCEKLNMLLDETYKTIADKEEKKVKKNSHLNITNSELHLMEEIARQGDEGCTITALAHALSCALPSVTVAVNKLERKGYVKKERCADDRRALRVSLTDRGNKVNDVHLYIHKRISREIVKNFNEEERVILIRGLEKIIEFFKNELYNG